MWALIGGQRRNRGDPCSSGHTPEPGLAGKSVSLAALLLLYSPSQAEKFRAVTECHPLIAR